MSEHKLFRVSLEMKLVKNVRVFREQWLYGTAA